MPCCSRRIFHLSSGVAYSHDIGSETKVAKGTVVVQLPKDAVKRADLGHSFAEYDLVRNDPQMFVETPSMRAPVGRGGSKCIFVGRRGSGKTATTYYLEGRDSKRTVLILPELFSSLDAYVRSGDEALSQRAFKTIVSSFKRSLLDEAVEVWQKNGALPRRSPQNGVDCE